LRNNHLQRINAILYKRFFAFEANTHCKRGRLRSDD
jgi:hypothetical protein